MSAKELNPKKEDNNPENFNPDTIVIYPTKRQSEHANPYAKIQQRRKAPAKDEGKGKASKGSGKKKPPPSYKLSLDICSVSNIFEYEYSKPQYGLLQSVVTFPPGDDCEDPRKPTHPYTRKVIKYADEFMACINEKINPHRDALGMDEDYEIPNFLYFDDKSNRYSIFCSVSLKNAIDLKTKKETDYGKYEVEKTNGEPVSLKKLRTLGYDGSIGEMVPEIKGKDGAMKIAWKLYKGIMAKPKKNDFKSTANLRAAAKSAWGDMTAEDEELLAGAGDDDSDSGEITINRDDDSDSEADTKGSKKKAAKAKKAESDSDSEEGKAPKKKAAKAKKVHDSGSDSEEAPKWAAKAKPAKKAESGSESGSEEAPKSTKKKEKVPEVDEDDVPVTKLPKKKFSPKLATE